MILQSLCIGNVKVHVLAFCGDTILQCRSVDRITLDIFMLVENGEVIDAAMKMHTNRFLTH